VRGRLSLRLMHALCELPANPFLVAYHVPIELTRAVVEWYTASKGSALPALVADILRIPGVQGVQFFRYELWVRRAHDATWHTIIPAVEAALRDRLGISTIGEFQPDQRYLTVACATLDVTKPLVFEGVEAAQTHPLTSALFALAGVAEVLLTPGRMRVRKGAAFRWEGLQHNIQTVLEQFVRNRPQPPPDVSGSTLRGNHG
jgi:scaffold Nfu/NifU family protein